jgi:hypothetical protein
MNPRNLPLIRNMGLLKIERITAGDIPGRPLPFAGPRFDPNTRTFQDATDTGMAFVLVQHLDSTPQEHPE